MCGLYERISNSDERPISFLDLNDRGAEDLRPWTPATVLYASFNTGQTLATTQDLSCGISDVTMDDRRARRYAGRPNPWHVMGRLGITAFYSGISRESLHLRESR